MSPSFASPLDSIVLEVAEFLRLTQTRIVLAESCTGGLVAATLARVPGISEFLCGSAVVYRLDTKTSWLGVPESLLRDPGPVSEPVARAMAIGVLQRTPEASLAAAITGHLGPQAPVDQDGLIVVAVARRLSDGIDSAAVNIVKSRLPAEFSQLPLSFGASLREQRQWKAAECVLTCIRNELAPA
jgi:nicotinamide-nucleotide amidase